MENQKEKSKGRSNPGTESSPNPAKIFIEWKSKNEKFSYYNKEKKEDVMLPMPFNFIPLFICSCVKGYNHKKNKTFISNEVENLSTDILTVTSYNNVTKEKKIEYKGLYTEIKDSFDASIKFTVSLYAAIKDKKGVLSLVNLQMNGASLHHWFKFKKENDIWKNAVSAFGITDEKNGTVDYKAPTYKAIKISQEDDEAAGILQEEIKTYLTAYFAKNGNTEQYSDTKNSDSEQYNDIANEKQDNGLNTKPSSKSDYQLSDTLRDEIANSFDEDDLPF